MLKIEPSRIMDIKWNTVEIWVMLKKEIEKKNITQIHKKT
jgi:hypothetical protein